MASAAAGAAVVVKDKEKDEAAERLRRLRFEPIWQALDERNYRKAVMLCDKKEVAHLPLAKVRG